ncbi:hypothetical protein LY90DRAFT_511777 [Neocallimastix californiae]|uniref:Uncharacterized protein n=1 Tax=Neocallimastix californiae TaxID=1754190 RepID=A0A1Y2BI61_9FUNG|nr:hypothetical protein LY90DRAFT_511777 [Neocallimastix californiae]|eukprot:ORY34482.1 hypothetical protein LY90DRAFT_511777 [Neocallimastix californiae]
MKATTEIIAMKEDDDFITSYNKFMMEKMHYLETTVETIQTLMEYHNYTIETIMGQEQNKQRIEKEKELQERNNELSARRPQESETAQRSLNRKDSFTTVSTAVNDENALLNNIPQASNSNENDDASSVKAIPDTTDENNESNEEGNEPKPEQGSTSLFDEIYNSEEANIIMDEYDNNTDFLRICKTVDFLIQDAYTAIMYIPTSNVPITSSMAYYATKYRAN